MQTNYVTKGYSIFWKKKGREDYCLTQHAPSPYCHMSKMSMSKFHPYNDIILLPSQEAAEVKLQEYLKDKKSSETDFTIKEIEIKTSVKIK